MTTGTMEVGTFIFTEQEIAAGIRKLELFEELSMSPHIEEKDRRDYRSQATAVRQVFSAIGLEIEHGDDGHYEVIA